MRTLMDTADYHRGGDGSRERIDKTWRERRVKTGIKRFQRDEDEAEVRAGSLLISTV